MGNENPAAGEHRYSENGAAAKYSTWNTDAVFSKAWGSEIFHVEYRARCSSWRDLDETTRRAAGQTSRFAAMGNLSRSRPGYGYHARPSVALVRHSSQRIL